MKKAVLGLLSLLAVAFVSCSEIAYELIDVSEYAVAFDAQGGTPVKTDTVLTGTTITLPATSRTDFIFNGWYDAPSFGNRIGGAGGKLKVINHIILYAQWKAIYTVTFDAQGGSVSPTSVSQPDSTIITLPTAAKSGFVLIGWSTQADGRDKVVGTAGGSYTVNSNITLYAQWAVMYTITFDANGGSVSPASITELNGKSVNLPSPSRPGGYRFDGWFSAAAGGERYYSPYTVQEYNQTMYAHWTYVGLSPATYTIYFEDSEGFSNYAPIEREVGETVNLPIPPIKSGYTFDGWYSEISGGTKFDNPYTIKANDFTANELTMYAHWTQNSEQPTTYTVTFDAKGGTDVSQMTNIKTGTAITLPWTSRDGYTFDGWYKATGERVGGVGDNYVVNANTTLYAHWTQNSEQPTTYTVTFDAKGGTDVSQMTNIKTGTAIPLPSTSRDGYTFDGWYDETGERVGGVGDSYTVNSNTTLYARWTPIIYTITFLDSPTEWYLESKGKIGEVIVLFAPQKSGYVFKGWSETETGDVKYSAGKEYTITGDKTFYAQWQ